MRTAISISLRVIPPSAGLSRIARKPQHATNYIKPRPLLRVVQDEDLEQEIRKYKEAQIG